MRHARSRLQAPAYAVIERCDDFEVREYEKMVVAKTPMDTSPTAGVQVACYPRLSNSTRF
jgi:hypothetical protein